jgi:hypothetical protein
MLLAVVLSYGSSRVFAITQDVSLVGDYVLQINIEVITVYKHAESDRQSSVQVKKLEPYEITNL